MPADCYRVSMFGQKHVLSREGGVEIVVKELSTRMAQRGHLVTCYDRRTKHVSGQNIDKRREYEGVIIRSAMTIDKRGLAAMTSSFSAAMKSAVGRYDVVHIHAEGPAAMSSIPKIFGKKVVVTIHGLDWARAKWGGFATKYIKWGEKQAVKWADEIIVLSRDVQDYFLREYGRKTHYIPNGVSRPKILDAEQITQKWGLKKDSYVLFLGRIVPEKGIEYLIKAWKAVHTDKMLVIAGGSSDTDTYMKELQSTASNNVIFTGFQQGKVLEELYSNAYIYCLPSDLEGMPLSLLEAMSYGNCCLVSDIAECTEVVEDKAEVFIHSNIESLISKLQTLLANPDIVNLYKINASDFICSKYNWDEIVDNTLRLYGDN